MGLCNRHNSAPFEGAVRSAGTAPKTLDQVYWDMHSIQNNFCTLTKKRNHTNKDVLGLHVAMDDPIVMKVMKCSHKLLCNVANDWLRKVFVVL